MAILSVTSWCESGPWCVGSRMTSPSSTPDRQISFYCNIHRGHHQITAAHTHRFPQATGTQMSMTVLLGNPQQQQVCVCVCVYMSVWCFSAATNVPEVDTVAAKSGRISNVQSRLLQISGS